MILPPCEVFTKYVPTIEAMMDTAPSTRGNVTALPTTAGAGKSNAPSTMVAMMVTA